MLFLIFTLSHRILAEWSVSASKQVRIRQETFTDSDRIPNGFQTNSKRHHLGLASKALRPLDNQNRIKVG